MFGLFKNNPEKKFQKEYKRLMAESFRLSKINRKLSDEKYAQAEQVMKQLEKLRRK